MDFAGNRLKEAVPHYLGDNPPVVRLVRSSIRARCLRNAAAVPRSHTYLRLHLGLRQAYRRLWVGRGAAANLPEKEDPKTLRPILDPDGTLCGGRAVPPTRRGFSADGPRSGNMFASCMTMGDCHLRSLVWVVPAETSSRQESRSVTRLFSKSGKGGEGGPRPGEWSSYSVLLACRPFAPSTAKDLRFHGPIDVP